MSSLRGTAVRRALVMAGLVLAACGALAACSASAPAASPTSTELADELAQARAQGAAPEQIAVLEEASRTGEVTIEQLRELNELQRDCFSDSGFSVFSNGSHELVDGSGWWLEDYGILQTDGASDDAIGAVLYDCGMKYLAFAQGAFMAQPRAVELQYARFDTPRVRDCLIGRGYDIDDAMTGQELENLAGEDLREHLQTDPNYPPCMPD